MASFAAQLLNELMGPDRNRAPNEKRRQIRWEDPEVCKFLLCGFCPHDLFTNTRADLGNCDKIHDEDLKTSYEKSSRYEKMGYEEDFVRFCQTLVSDVEKRIRRGQARLSLNNTTSGYGSGSQAAREEKVQMLSEKINELVEQAEQLGCEGKVEEAQGVMKLCEQLKEERTQLQAAGQRQEMASSAKEMEVCNICGALLVSGDAQQRVDEHVMGKQHMGYARIRSFIEERKRKLRGEDVKVDTAAAEEREEREKERLEREKEREREREERRRRQEERDKEREERDREKEREVQKERDREKEREVQKERDREKDRERRDKEKKRSRSKEKERERKRSRSRERERRRSRSRDRSERSKEHQERRRSRSRSRSRRKKSRSRSRDRKRRSRSGSRGRSNRQGSRDRDNKDRTKDRDRDRGRDRDRRASRSSSKSRSHRSRSHSRRSSRDRDEKKRDTDKSSDKPNADRPETDMEITADDGEAKKSVEPAANDKEKTDSSSP